MVKRGKMGRIMISGTSSGAGKTTIVCAILQALVNRGIKTVSYKCGPDYIDPMFHSKVIGTKSRNLDGVLMEEETLRYLLYQNGKNAQMSVIEGVMGYYDGIGMEETGSSCDIARITETPVILVLPCKGMSRSIQALLTGFLQFESKKKIKGVIFNQLPASLYPDLKKFCEKQGIKAFGYFPHVKEAEIESRYLGLVTVDELDHIKEKMQLLAETAENFLDMKGILELAEEASEMPACEIPIPICRKPANKIRIGVARDLAFCFYYEDNFEFLRKLGCDIIPFSPMEDRELPRELDGMILGGGYPELYAKNLSENIKMITQIREQIMGGLVTHAECGGFMYLHKFIQDLEGKEYPMVGIIDGTCYYTEKLQHFGYATLTAERKNILCDVGEKMKVHEFHRYKSTAWQDVFCAKKGEVTWKCGSSSYHVFAAFSHMHYYANLKFASSFYENCIKYREKRESHIRNRED